MKRRVSFKPKGITVLIALNFLSCQSWATPSTTYWTPCTIDIQPYNVRHVTYDNYTTLGKHGPARGGQAFPNDLGLTVGVLPFEKIQMEVGFDWLEPTDHPLSFNAKMGSPEGALFKGSPAIEVGAFNVGTERGVTNQNVADVIMGRSLPEGLGRLHLGAYVGNSKVLRDSQGKRENAGAMIGYDRGFWPVGSSGGSFKRLVLAADYASGDNAIGGGGAGLYVYFNKDTSLLFGPVWFNDEGINGEWKWTTQLDINF
ncbi:MAG: hypothetical protein LHV69_09045 [Elusimicrobia bacterium]|nr:hypothetical protein [Candidatus Obscuribacterium magneticum]